MLYSHTRLVVWHWYGSGYSWQDVRRRLIPHLVKNGARRKMCEFLTYELQHCCRTFKLRFLWWCARWHYLGMDGCYYEHPNICYVQIRIVNFLRLITCPKQCWFCCTELRFTCSKSTWKWIHYTLPSKRLPKWLHAWLLRWHWLSTTRPNICLWRIPVLWWFLMLGYSLEGCSKSNLLRCQITSSRGRNYCTGRCNSRRSIRLLGNL
jgi:hypothetical protein